MTNQRYSVIFVEDFSRKCCVLFMPKKGHTFSKFSEFKSLVEKETRRKVKAPMSDNSGEYVSNEFEKVLGKERNSTGVYSTP